MTIDGVDIHDKTVAEIWNGPEAREFRASILDGSFRYCKMDCCPHMNQDGVPYWEKNGSPYQKIENITDPRLKDIIEKRKTVLDDGPLVLNCAYDKSCNLSCPSCRSKVYALKSDEIAPVLEFQERIFKEVAPRLEVLYVSGNGDPFASAVYRNLLRNISADDYPKMEVHLGTNATLWTKENWDAMHRLNKSIKSTHISIDAACAETYAVNRRGGDWDKLMRNFEFISQLRRSGQLRYMTLSFVVQQNNFKEMPAFVKLAERFGFDMVYFQKLQDWGSYNDWGYDQRTIQSPLHPQHAQFLKVLTDPLLGQPNVGLFCLLPLRKEALDIASRPGGLGWYTFKVFVQRLLLFPWKTVKMLKRKLIRKLSK
jgi:wyosine [tRNA(Phe)-imidazoG37] synthetase (radical SAM superfamily)